MRETIKIIQTLLVLIAIISIGIITVLVIRDSLRRTEINECNKWKREASEIDIYYLTDWQVAQCSAHSINIELKKVNKIPDEIIEKTQARITKYGWTGNTMANGEYPYIGAVATSDRSIPLGTIIEIDGKEYAVKDRTAKWVHEKFGITFDIYSEDSYKEMMEFGAQKMVVVIK